jgi:hypothetical protein
MQAIADKQQVKYQKLGNAIMVKTRLRQNMRPEKRRQLLPFLCLRQQFADVLLAA